MKKFALILVLFLLKSWPVELGRGTESQDSNAGKTPAARSKNTEEQKKPGKEAAVQQHGTKKTNSKEKEDCGCETTLFGEPVSPQIKESPQGKSSVAAGQQTTLSKKRNDTETKPASHSNLKKETQKKTEKRGAASADTPPPKKKAAEEEKK